VCVWGVVWVWLGACVGGGSPCAVREAAVAAALRRALGCVREREDAPRDDQQVDVALHADTQMTVGVLTKMMEWCAERRSLVGARRLIEVWKTRARPLAGPPARRIIDHG
jgi:hypothetical protein